MTKRKIMCCDRACGWQGNDDEILYAPNPFDSEQTISGCPKCKDVDVLVYACDEPGCWDLVSSGTPTDTGYRSTCYKHRPKDIEKEPAK